MLTIVDVARETALELHHGQVNKHDGEPYILHVNRVATSVSHDPMLGDVHQAVAWLHDTIEDTDLTPEGLVDTISHRFAEWTDVYWAVLAITKVKGETNEDYYHRVKANPIAAAVKLHDIHDNFGRTHSVTDPDTAARLAKKYSLGIDILKRVR
jgi:(p)ppGpp synthase/HD superfamily hydrolase